MKSYAETVIAQWEIDLFHKAEDIVRGLPFKDPMGRLVRCHEVARAVGRILGLPVQDGHFWTVEHSWLWTEEPRGFMPNIIDVYSVGRLPVVQLVDSRDLRAYARDFRPGKRRKDIRWKVVGAMLESVRGR